MKKHNYGRIINNIVNRFGIEIHRHIPQQRAGSLRSMYDVCMQAKKCGINTKTIFDVGVANGTPELYKAFPNATFVLVEPISEFDEYIELILDKYKGYSVKAAAGDRCGRMEIKIDKRDLHGTSFFSDLTERNSHSDVRMIDVTTLDNVNKKYQLHGPYLIKADVQGAELNVINGALEILKQTELVILETSFFEFRPNTPQFYDVIVSMKEKGFVVYDFIGGAIRPYDGALGQIDIAFAKENGVLRQSHSYGSFRNKN